MMQKLFLIIIVFLRYGSAQYNFKEISFSTVISKTVNQVIYDFYMHKSSTLLITKSSLNIKNYEKQMGVINEIIYSTNSSIIFIVEDYWFIGSSAPQRFYNLIFIDSYEAFVQIFKVMKNDNLFDYTGYYTIVLTESPRNQYIIINKILGDCWSIYITNVLIVTSMGSEPNSNSALYTYFPYTVFHCETVAPVILNYFVQNSFLYNIEHFPDKLKNMHKCPLTVVTHNVTPFMILFQDPRSVTGYRTDGIDGITFRVLAQQLNFTPIIKIPPKANGSSIFMETVVSGKANLTIGGFSFTIKRAKLMSASAPYLYSSLLYAVPVGKPYSAFENLFLPFEFQIWILIGSMLLLALIIVTFLSKNKLQFLVGCDNQTPFFNTILILYGGSLSILPTRNFARTILIIWIFGCIVLRSAFQGSLFEYIQKPRNSPSASTFSELIDRNYTLFMSTAIFQLFRNTSKFNKNIQIHNFGTDEKFDILLNANFNGAVLTTDLGISYYNKHHFKDTGFVYSTKERMFLLPFCIFFRKHSCLNAPVTKRIGRYTSSGLLGYWINQYFEKRFVKAKNSQFDIKFENQQLQRLSIEQLRGIFTLTYYMLIFAILVFLAELMSRRIEFIRKIFIVLS